MQKLSLLILLLFTICFGGHSQETIRLMHYNLLNYGINTGGCNNSNNNVNDKNDNLLTIMDYLNPHVLTVNEINCSVQTYDKLLTGCLDEYMSDMFERVDKTCPSSSDLSNMIYFRKDIFGFHSQYVIPTNVRDINVVKLYYKSANLGQDPDTIFLNCIITHLKAGSDWDDEIERTDETNRLMNFLEQNSEIENYLLLGDLNIYRASEQAFQNLINYSNPSFRFYDPINMIGEWHNNSSYSMIHTQSTHTVHNCFIPGGMDDRFDFILISNDILSAENKVSFDQNSYRAVGQDGKRFNKNLIESPSNTSVPSNVLNALYNLSDHLPVVMDLYVGENALVGEKHEFGEVYFENPVKETITLRFAYPAKRNVRIKLYSTSAVCVADMTKNAGLDIIEIPIQHLRTGIYFMEIYIENKKRLVKKIVKI